MQVIFITPLLWKKLDRAALRRGEEGQALVIVAFLAIILVAMMGLSVDSGMAYLTSQELQRAADSAALAGVQWQPNQPAIADGRASLSAEANGAKVACYYDKARSATDPYNQRCHRASLDDLNASRSDQDLYYMETSTPPGQEIMYRVTLAKRQPRFFLSVLDAINPGFGEFTIMRTATAAYDQLVRFGSSFNYFGTNGVEYDHYMRCGNANVSQCAGTSNQQLIMRGATYQKYIVMRCDQPNPPKPVCIGGFWGHIAGPDMAHSNGDGFNPTRDGATGPTGSCGIAGNSCIGSNAGAVQTCLHTSDADYTSAATSNFATWFVNDLFQPDGSPCDKQSAGIPIINYDTHSDSPSAARGFGYEIGVQVGINDIYNVISTTQNPADHTNLNITIFDAAMNDQGNAQLAVGDNYQPNTGVYSNFPHKSWSSNGHNNTGVTSANQWETRTFICSPGTPGCSSATPTSPSKPTLPKRGSGTADFQKPATQGGLAVLFPDPNNIELTYNDVRTRFTLYGPPNLPSSPATYQNVVGNRIDSFEATDMSIRHIYNGSETTPAGTAYIPHDFPIQDTSVNKDAKGNLVDYSGTYCYFIFDDQKVFWNNYRDPSTTTNSLPVYNTPTSGTGPDFAYTYDSKGNRNGQLPSSGRYSYVCPSTDSGAAVDYRWNILLGTPTARYGPLLGNASNVRTIENGILKQEGGVSDVANSPIATATLGSNLVIASFGGKTYTDTIQQADINPQSAYNSGFVKSIWSPNYVLSSTVSGKAQVALGYANIVDPGQNCRPSAVDYNADPKVTGWPIDPQWGHNRIPFNMAYNDPLTNRAWVTDTSKLSLSNAVASGQINGYYTLAYAFHGWRCDWDFDSNYVRNPLQNPNSPPGPSNLSLSGFEQAAGGAYYNIAFAEGHPGLTSNSYMDKLLTSDSVPQVERCRDMIPTGGSGIWQQDCSVPNVPPNDNAGTHPSTIADRDFGLEPYFHLTNVQWDSGRTRLEAVANTQQPPVRAGTYMVHIQVFSGSGANRYSLKAEYENPLTYVDAASGVAVTPVPSVFAVTAMAIYANNDNSKGTAAQNVVFDLANIPASNAGTLAIVELWDAGDVGGSLSIEIRQPSGWGPRVNTNNTTDVTKWTVPWDTNGGDNKPIATRLTVCPYTLTLGSSGLAASCATSTVANGQTAWQAASGNSFYNDEWMLISFNIPPASSYNTWKNDCAAHGVPESLCYYYQINYQLGAGTTANDTTTWQLVVQGQPVHLVP